MRFGSSNLGRTDNLDACDTEVIASFITITPAANSSRNTSSSYPGTMVPPKPKGAPTVEHIKERNEERTPDPILTLRFARLEAKKVTEKEAHYTDDKVYAPKVSIWWEILDDKQGGSLNGTRFWDNYSFVKSYDDDKKYVLRKGTRIGDLAAFMAYEFHNGANYFESDVQIAFEDLEGEEVVASTEPRRFKEGEPPTGTRTVSTTLQLAERAEKVTTAEAYNRGTPGTENWDDKAQGRSEEDQDVDEKDFEDIPF
jgi:hypothetical protein